jgi:hypothetical protein
MQNNFLLQLHLLLLCEDQRQSPNTTLKAVLLTMLSSKSLHIPKTAETQQL